MKRRKAVLKIPQVDNTYGIKEYFRMKKIKMELVRKKLANFLAKFFDVTNVYAEINHI